MATEDDLPLNAAGNPYDPIFAGRIAALGGGSGTSPAPRPPRTSGGGGAWGGWLLAVIVGINVMRGCANSTSSDSIGRFDHNSFRGGNPDLRLGDPPQFDDFGRDDRPGLDRPAGDGQGPEPEVP